MCHRLVRYFLCAHFAQVQLGYIVLRRVAVPECIGKARRGHGRGHGLSRRVFPQRDVRLCYIV